MSRVSAPYAFSEHLSPNVTDLLWPIWISVPWLALPSNLQLLICPMPNSVAVYRIFFNLYLFNYLGNPEFFWIKSPNAIVGLFGLCPLMCHTDILSKPNSEQWVYWRGFPPSLIKKAWTNVADTGNLPSLLGRPECIIKCMIQASLCILYYKIYPLLLLSFN